MEKDIREKVGKAIREARKANGLTQKEVGEKMGVSESTFNRYETGDANLSIVTVEKIAVALGIEAYKFFM